MESAPSVLIVDDEAVMVMMFELRLRARGYAIRGTASTKEDAIRQAIDNKPDFVLMDIRLTGENDGIEAAHEIKQRIPTRIIFMTGYSNEEVKKRAMETQPLAYLVKPFEITEVMSIMEHAAG